MQKSSTVLFNLRLSKEGSIYCVYTDAVNCLWKETVVISNNYIQQYFSWLQEKKDYFSKVLSLISI